RHSGEAKAVIQAVLPYLWVLPSSFAGDFVAQASAGLWLGAFVRLVGLLAYVLLLSTLLWQRYTKLYAGEELSEGTAPSHRVNRAESEDVDDSDAPGFFPPQVGAVFRKEMHYLKRNSFLFFSLAIPPLMVFFFSMQFAGIHSGPLHTP